MFLGENCYREIQERDEQIIKDYHKFVIVGFVLYIVLSH